jgi:aminoglycoside 2'-N-acetyltransferase I
MPDRRRSAPGRATGADDLVLRRAGAGDADAVRRLVHRAYEDYAPLLGRTPFPMLADYDVAVREHEIWLLMPAGSADRAAILELIEEPTRLWIENVAVDPAWQGNGLGRRLLQFADEEARRRDLPELGLLTNERYLKNIAMYERYGYVETHREPRLGTDLIYFRKPTPGLAREHTDPARSRPGARDGRPNDASLRVVPTAELTEPDIAAIRGLMTAAFGSDPEERFEDADWDHALCGTHVLVERDGAILAHAAVVPRDLHVGGRPVRVGYVEAVATAPDVQGQGFGTMAMREVGRIVAAGSELGALGTGSHGFYERLGWRTWRGPSSVRTEAGERATPEDDGYLMVLRTPSTPAWLPDALDAPISCEWRPGDVW